MKKGIFAFIAVVSTLPLLVLFGHYLTAQDPVPVMAVGDHAIIELYTLRACEGEQLLGPYSRFRWNHPGPLLFYCFVPIYTIFDRSAVGLHLAALCINLCCIAFLYFLGRWNETRYHSAGLVLCFTFFLVYSGHEFFANPLNPLVTVLPFGCLLLLFSLVAAGHITFLPLFVFFASLLVQSHVGYLTSVLFMGLFVMPNMIVSLLQPSHRTGASRLSTNRLIFMLVSSSLLLIVLWLPPLIEQFSHQTGNLSKLVDFFASGGKKHGFIEVSFHLSRQLSLIPLQILTYFKINIQTSLINYGCLAFGGLQVAGLLVCLVVAVRRDWSVMQNQCLIGLLCLMTGFLSMLFVEGVIKDYLIQWLSMLGLFNVSIITALFLSVVFKGGSQSRKALIRWVGATAWCLVIVLLIVHYVATMDMRLPHDIRQSQTVEAIYTAMKQHMDTSDHDRSLIDIRVQEQWSFIAGVVVLLSKDGLSPAVNNDWLYMFGNGFEQRGDEKQVFIFGDSLIHRKLKSVHNVNLISNEGGIFVFVVETDDVRSLVF